MWKPELHRLRGELLLRSGTGSPEAAAEAFGAALDLARDQGSLALELRAAVSLARLRLAAGRPDEVRSLLEPLLASITGGRDERDVREASALLSTAAGSPASGKGR
jgi:predicted ATPase